MTSKFKVGEIVRIVDEPAGSINEFARIDQIFGNGTFWISNINQPFSGSICGTYGGWLLEKTEDSEDESYNEEFMKAYG